MNSVMQLDDKFDDALHRNEYTLADVYRDRMRTARDKAFTEIQNEFKALVAQVLCFIAFFKHAAILRKLDLPERHVQYLIIDNLGTVDGCIFCPDFLAQRNQVFRYEALAILAMCILYVL